MDMQALATGTETIRNEQEIDAVSPLLLTYEPIAAFNQELYILKRFVPRFETINVAIYNKLEYDQEADNVRAAFYPFNRAMDKITGTLICDSYNVAQVAYAYNLELKSSVNTDGMLSAIMNTKWQEAFLDCVRKAADRGKTAVDALRTEVLPMLPLLSIALSSYINSYTARYGTTNEPSSGLQYVKTIFMRPPPPAQWNLEGVQSLQFEFEQGIMLLKRVPRYLDNWEHHFRTIARLTMKDISALGYSSKADFRRLYTDFIRCHRIINEMRHIWYIVSVPFGQAVAEVDLAQGRAWSRRTAY
ncbi:hypothetical protein FRC17_001650 [Serendipita sp. 399]|nr:hypothetical protein FRC17_001650 [Serendipita sp. 399]